MSSSPAYGAVSLANLHITVWRRAAAPEDVKALRDELVTLMEDHHRFGVLLVVPAGIPVSPEPARKSAAAMLRELREHIAAIGLVIEGGGFGTAAVRSMFTGLSLLLRTPWPWKMFADVDAAAAWMATQLPRHRQLDAATIEVATEAARRRAARFGTDE